MEKKTILICLEVLGIGGVETSVYNQSISFKQKGYNVVILAKKGIYTEKLESRGIVCIDFEFKLGNEIDWKKTYEIIKIIKEYNIEQVHIHQFPCLLSAFPACIVANIPYLAFVHSRQTEVYDWYINCFGIYKKLFKFYFENAYKIITLNKGAIELNINYFGTNKEKYRVLKNSISFNEYTSAKEVKNINDFMVISRIAPEKIKSIKNGINLFLEYADKCNNFNGKLSIYGDGSKECINEIENYIKEHNTNNYNVLIAGATNEVAKEMENHDVVIAMGRCIIEALATKRIAILTSPDELKFLIDTTNIHDAIEGNFASNDLPAQSLESIVDRLKNLSKENIKNITKENYDIAYKELNMITNVYCIEELPINENYEIKLIELMDIQAEDLKRQRDENLEKYNRLYEQSEISKKEKIIEEQKNSIENLEKRNIELYNELTSVYNSKRFKVVNKIANTLTRKNK